MRPEFKTFCIIFIGPFLVACMLGSSLYSLWRVEVNGLHVNNTTLVTGRPATVSYSVSTPAPSLVVKRRDVGEYTLVRPTSSYTRVYLGPVRGFDTSTLGPKTLDYITSSKPIFNSGRPYNFRNLPKFMRPPATWRSGM
nr:MAG: ORF5 protein [Bamboo rat coronavirus]